MKQVVRAALVSTLPVMTGYLVLGFGFGMILKANGFHIFLALAMSLFIYAGSMQYVALTALFITVFVEQWMSRKRHAPALIGVCVSVTCLLIFGKERFLIPAMLIITLLLCLGRKEEKS